MHGIARLADPEDVPDDETLRTRVSRWLRLDLPRKVAGLGLPVTTVTARERAPTHA